MTCSVECAEFMSRQSACAWPRLARKDPVAGSHASKPFFIGAFLQLFDEGTLLRRGRVELELDTVQEVKDLRSLELTFHVQAAEGVNARLGRFGRRCAWFCLWFCLGGR